MRRKAARFGIWVNTDAVEIDRAPSFYAVATTRPARRDPAHTEDLRYRISTRRAIRSVGAPTTSPTRRAFTDALIRIRERERALPDRRRRRARCEDDAVLDASIALPANLTEGDYTARIFLTRDGEVIDRYATAIYVQKVGLERLLYNLAHEQPLIYGLLSLVHRRSPPAGAASRAAFARIAAHASRGRYRASSSP